jgi:hypothetical protein
MMTNNQSTPPSMYSRGGIDQQIQDGMNRAGNDPAKAKEVYGKSGDVKDLLVWQKLANTFKEIDKATALAKNGSPPTLMDSLPQEVMGRMTGKQNLQEKASGVAGVLQTQQQQQQQQQGQPQGQPKLASGGIINAPAPNLNRMYNGGIVGYAEGGLTRDEVAAYLKEVGITEAEFEAATSEEQERVVAGINKKIAEDRDLGTARSKGSLNVFGGTTKSDAQMEDRNRGLREFFTAPFRSDPTGEELMKGREEFNPTERQDAAKRRMNLPDTTIADIRGPLVNEAGFGERIAGMPGREQFEQRVAEDTDMYAADEAAAIAKADEAKRLAGLPPPKREPTPLEIAAGDIGAPVVDSSKKTGITSVLPEGNGMSPVMTREERGQKVLEDVGLDKKQDISALEPFMRKPEVNPKQSLVMTPEQQAEANKPLSGSALIQKQLDGMGRKKGIAGLIQLAANTNFKPSYGTNYEAAASAGRDIAETRQKETARERKFLEDQLGVQQAIEAKAIEAAEATRQYDATLGQRVAEAEQQGEQHAATEGRLTTAMNNLNTVQMKELSLKTRKATFDSLAKLEELGIAKADSAANRKYKESALALQLQANQYKQDGVIADLHKVVEGYVGSATSFYRGLLANATGAEAAVIKQELQAEIARISKILGPDNTLDLSALERGVGAAPSGGFTHLGPE